MDLQLPRDLVTRFTARTRLFDLLAGDLIAEPVLERWQTRETLSEPSTTKLIGISTDAHLALDECSGVPVALLGQA